MNMNLKRKKYSYREISLKNADQNQLEMIQQVLYKSPHSTIFHSIEWNQIVVNLTEKDCFYGIACYNDDPVGLIYFYLDYKKRNLYSPYYDPLDCLYGGPAVCSGSPLSVADFLLDSINKKYKSFNRLIRTSPLFKNTFPPSFKNSNQMLTALVDLRVGQEGLWESLKKNARRDVRLAQRRGVNVVEGKEEHISSYFQMRKETLAHEHGTDQIEKTLFDKFIRLGSEKNILRFLIALYEEKIIAGAVFGIWNKRMYFHSAAFDHNYREFCPNDLIQWEQIKWGFANGYEIYDMCYIEPERYPGIARFKMKFGGTQIPFKVINQKNIKNRLKSRLNFLLNRNKTLS